MVGSSSAKSTASIVDDRECAPPGKHKRLSCLCVSLSLSLSLLIYLSISPPLLSHSLSLYLSIYLSPLPFSLSLSLSLSLSPFLSWSPGPEWCAVDWHRGLGCLHRRTGCVQERHRNARKLPAQEVSLLWKEESSRSFRKVDRCVCVCVWERERERERESLLLHLAVCSRIIWATYGKHIADACTHARTNTHMHAHTSHKHTCLLAVGGKSIVVTLTHTHITQAHLPPSCGR